MNALTYFMRGFALIRQPGIKCYVIGPLLMNIVLFIGAIWFLIHTFEQTIQYLIPSWLSWLEWLLWPLLAVGILAGVFFGFSIVANLIAAPFHGLLAAAVESHLKGQRVAEPSVSTTQQILYAIRLELYKIGYYLIRALPLLLLSLIPGLNLITFPLWLIFSAWFLAYDAVSYVLENHQMAFKQQLAVIRGQRWSLLSYGGLSLGAAMVPGLNLISPAAAVAGATAMMHERGVLDRAMAYTGSAISASPD